MIEALLLEHAWGFRTRFSAKRKIIRINLTSRKTDGMLFVFYIFQKPGYMKKTSKLLIGVGIAAVTTGLIIYAMRRYRSSQRRTRVANEGYETAHDILYPQKRRKKVHYGPVLPE